MSIISLLEQEQHSSYTTEIVPDTFTITANAFFFSFSKWGTKIPISQLKVLDTETLKLNEFSLHYLGKKQLVIQGQSFATKLFKMIEKNEDAMPSYLWVTDAVHPPTIVKWQGEDNGEPFTLLLDIDASTPLTTITP